MSVAESKTNALFDQGFVQTGVMLRKEDKACIVTDMGRVEWFQVNPWGGVQALSAAPVEPPGIRALMCVISSLRDTTHFSDEKGELTNDLRTLRDWAYAQTAAFQPSPAAQADSVLEDAALWHWLAEYLVGPRTDLDDAIVASETVNDLRKLVEAAIKQGATP